MKTGDVPTAASMSASQKSSKWGKPYIFFSMNCCVTPHKFNLFRRRKKLWYERKNSLTFQWFFLIHVFNDIVLIVALPNSER